MNTRTTNSNFSTGYTCHRLVSPFAASKFPAQLLQTTWALPLQPYMNCNAYYGCANHMQTGKIHHSPWQVHHNTIQHPIQVSAWIHRDFQTIGDQKLKSDSFSGAYPPRHTMVKHPGAKLPPTSSEVQANHGKEGYLCPHGGWNAW